jgi:quercetin dioxygenase-like cupin family protein
MNFARSRRLYNNVNNVWLPRSGQPGYEERRLVIAPGTELPSRAGEWVDSLVIVQSGRIEVICRAGSRRLFEAGSVLCLSWLPLRALLNPGSEPVVLVAVRRPERSVEAQTGTYYGRQW